MLCINDGDDDVENSSFILKTADLQTFAHLETDSKYVVQIDKTNHITLEFQILVAPTGRGHLDNWYMKLSNMSRENPHKAGLLNYLGDAYLQAFKEFELEVDLRDAVEAYKAAVSLTHPTSPKHLLFLEDLGIALETLCQVTEEEEDFRVAIDVRKKVANISFSNKDPKTATRMNSLGNVIWLRLEYGLGTLRDLDDVIDYQRSAVDLSPKGHVDLAAYCTDLGNALITRFQKSEDSSQIDLEQAYDAHRQAVDLTTEDDENLENRLVNLSGTLRIFMSNSSFGQEHIENSIKANGKIVASHKANDEIRRDALGGLGNALLRRAAKHVGLDDIDAAILAYKECVDLTPKDDKTLPTELNNLGVALERRYERTGDNSDVDQAIEMHEKSVAASSGDDEDLPVYRNNWASALKNRYDLKKIQNDIEKAIQIYQDTIDGISEDHPLRATLYHNLGSSLSHRFEFTGELRHIDDSILERERAVAAAAPTDENIAAYYNGLGDAFLTRYDRSGNMPDLEMAISAYEKSVDLVDDDHEDKNMFLSNLGSAYRDRFEALQVRSDIDAAISVQRKACALVPENHSLAAAHVNNLGNSLITCYGSTKDKDDLKAAVEAHRKCVELTRRGDRHVAKHNSNLAYSLLMLFRDAKDLATAKEAIGLLEKSVEVTPQGHPDRALWMYYLGDAFYTRYEQLHDHADLESAVTQYRQAAEYTAARPSVQLYSAKKWGMYSLSTDPRKALYAYATALRLLPQVAWLGETINDRHSRMAVVDDLANEAAAAAISQGELNTALEWLEQGRGIVWSQLSDLRTPVRELEAKHEELAKEFVRVSKALEHAGSRAYARNSDIVSSTVQMPVEEEGRRQHRLAEEWESLIAQIKQLDGFEDFMQPASWSKMLASGSALRPVVIINVHKTRSDALILHDTQTILHLHLHQLSYEKAIALRNALKQCLTSGGVQVRDTRASKLAYRASAGLGNVLAILWTHVVKPVLDVLEISPSADPRRLWWCTTGPLTFLPLHAAGIYGSGKAKATALDYVVSSYTPTISALLQPRDATDTNRSFTGILAVSVPNREGLAPIPNTTKEAAHIRELASKLKLKHCILEKTEATAKKVAIEMEDYNWIHLACHASQETGEPSKSAFFLHDSPLELSAIIKKRLKNADFAFLSACQTAAGDENVAEESVHLAAGMLSAGYRSVIASMWSIKDKTAPILAGDVYSYLFDNAGDKPEPNSSLAAFALHAALQHLRKDNVDSEEALLSWVPFIHVGN
ncbi:CHAT domain-containing protein [Cyathus striatus]|nr:CHAT domain-containing protein [Cyathus striatus]